MFVHSNRAELNMLKMKTKYTNDVIMENEPLKKKLFCKFCQDPHMHKVRPDQINMAVLFWYASVRYCRVACTG